MAVVSFDVYVELYNNLLSTIRSSFMRRSVSDKTKCLFCYVPSLCLLLINGWKRDSEIRIYLQCGSCNWCN